MSITTPDKIFEVDDSEYGYGGGTTSIPGQSSISLYIPKIMGNIGGTGPDNNAADGIFDNDSACKLSFAKKVNRAKSMSVTLEKNGLWLATLDGGGMIPKGTKFRVHFLNGNIDKPYASTN